MLAEEKRKAALNNISHEIHDNVGQTLSLIKLNLHLIDLLQQKDSPSKLKDSIGLLSKAIQDLRNISHDIYSESDEISLVDSVKRELEAIGHFYVVNFHLEGEQRKLSSQAEQIVFRVFKEALNNILKHADAKRIDVCVRHSLTSFFLSIKDDGVGIDLKSKSSNGQGIKSMYSRIKLLGGNFEMCSNENRGTLVSITLPL